MRRRPQPATVASAAVVGGLVAFLFWQLHGPSLLFLNTLTAGGDTGAHVALPAFMRDHLIPHGRLTGWDPQWYDGFPLFTFYFPLPSLLVVLLNVVLPYDVAFKLVTASGTLALPVAAWAFGRLWGMRRPVPELLAVASLPYLFDRTYTIYGGNIASTLAGEYAFSISLAVGLVFLGLVARGMRTGRHAGTAAVLLAVTGLSHLLPTLFVLVGAGVILLMHWGRRQLAWVVPIVITGALLAGFWWIPFYFRLGYTTDMGWQKATNYLDILFPSGDYWVVAAAGAGALLSLALRYRPGMFLTAMALISAAAVRLAPQGKIWNARFLPFWLLCLYLLAGVFVGEGARRLSGLLAGPAPWREPASMGAAVAAGLAAVAFVGIPLGAFPFHLGVSDHSFVPDWIRWNYSGYEGKASWPEYRALVTTMEGLGRTDGCGRAMWEYEPELNRFGTPMALMLLPYWTDDCIGSMEGLLFESAASTPYHFLNQSELSQNPSDAMLGLPYAGLDVTKGIQHLQMLGVKYYMTFSPEIQARASADPALRLVATSGPWPVQYSTGTVQRTWYVYEVSGSEMVAPLRYEPAVVTGSVSKASAWLKVSVPWYQDPSRWAVPLAASGPPGWPRVPAGDTRPPRRPVAAVHASRVRVSDDRISFDVDRTGSPVVVRTSYAPNWQVSGARGPYRITPNLMVVIPTSRHVSLHYGWTPVDWLGGLASLAGLAGVVLLSRRRPWSTEPVARRGGETDPDGPPGPGEPEAGGPLERVPDSGTGDEGPEPAAGAGLPPAGEPARHPEAPGPSLPRVPVGRDPDTW